MRILNISTSVLFAFVIFVLDLVYSRSLLEVISSRRNQHKMKRDVTPLEDSDSDSRVISDLTTITLAVILPVKEPYLFRRDLVQPAIEYAVESVRSEMASMGYRFRTSYRESDCTRRAALAAVDLYYDDDAMYNRSRQMKKDVGDELRSSEDDSPVRKRREARNGLKTGDCTSGSVGTRNRDLPLVFLGPACNEAAAIVSAFADSWNVPLITSGAPAGWIVPGPEFPTLTRVGSSHADLAYFVASILQVLGYGTKVPVHLLYEDNVHGSTAERECFYVMHAIYHVLTKRSDVQVYGPTSVPTRSEFYEDTVVSEMGDPRVVVMCASSEVVRRVMIRAYKAGFANPSHSVWYAIDLHNSSHYAKGAWRRGDNDDDTAKQAYKALQLITVYAKNNFRFNNFMKKMANEYGKAGIQEEVNEFVVGFYDAIILYTDAVRRTLLQRIDIRDGLAISRNMRNVTINGIAGPLVMGARGDRHGDYSILTMTDFKTGTFSSVYDYLGTFETIRDHGIQRLDLSDDSETEVNYTIKHSGVDLEEILAEAKRGLEKSKKLIQSTTQHEILAGILGTFGGMILCCLLIFGPMCYHRRHRSRTPMSENGNGIGPYLNGNSDQVSLHRPLREEGSVATCATSIDDDQKL